MTGTFAAWLADDEGSPATRFVRSAAPYVRTDGVPIANDWTDLTDGTIAAAIAITASGTLVDQDAAFVYDVWTNVLPDGTTKPADPLYGPMDCKNWSYAGAQASGATGQLNLTAYWTTGPDQRCDAYINHLYCFEQP